MSLAPDGPTDTSSLMAREYMSNKGIYGLFLGAVVGTILLLCFVIVHWAAAAGSTTQELLDTARRSLFEATAGRMSAEQRRAAASESLSALQAQNQSDADLVTAAEQEERDARQALDAAREKEASAIDRLHRAEKERIEARPSERDVLLMVIMLGALGGFLHFLGSLSVYLGERRLERSWTFHYVALPLRGAGLAPIVYLLLRVGILTPGASVEGTSALNLPAIYGVAGLTGLFAKLATEKLAEVFKTLFRTAGDTRPPEAEPPSESPRRPRTPGMP